MKRAAASALGLFLMAAPVRVFAQTPPPMPTFSPSPPPLRRPVPTPARPPAPLPPKTEGVEPSNDLRAHVGVDMARRLLGSGHADDRLRGIVRAGHVGSPEALGLLLQAAEQGSSTRFDARAAIALARALAPYAAEKNNARTVLLGLVSAANPANVTRSTGANDDDEGDPVLRMEFARQTAAMALAASGETTALEGLLGIVRTGGPGYGAALAALSAYPSPNLSLSNPALMTPGTIQLAADLGDLRSLDGLARAARSMDAATRSAALVALGKLGDGRAVDLAEAALGDGDPRVRAAAVRALVALQAPNRFWAVKKLVDDDAAVAAGIDLPSQAQDREVTRALIGRLGRVKDADLARAVVFALGKSDSAEAAAALGERLADPALESDAAHALARAPGRTAREVLEKALGRPDTRRVALRALVARALSRGDRSEAAVSTARSLSSSKDGRERALGVFARLALGEGSLDEALRDADPRVRRAAAMARLCDASAYRTLLSHAARERDPTTKQVLLAGLARGDARGEITTLTLLDHAQAAGADAPLAAFALAERTTPLGSTNDAQVSALLKSGNPLVRAHALRGLAASALPSSVGQLAEAYAYETDVTVRRAIVSALASKSDDSPSKTETLHLASRLDPEAAIRWLASRALAKAPPPAESLPSDVTWIHLVAAARGAPLPKDVVGSLVRSDGVALPIVFDDDGYALVPGMAPGAGRLVLAPRLSAYDAPHP